MALATSVIESSEISPVRRKEDTPPKIQGITSGPGGLGKLGGLGRHWPEIGPKSIEPGAFLLLGFTQQRLHLSVEGGEVGLDNAPHHSVRDLRIPVNQTIAEGDDASRVGDRVGQARVHS